MSIESKVSLFKTGAAFLLLALAAACGSSDSETLPNDDDPGSVDTTPPIVSSSVPLDAAIEVATGGNLTVTFSEAIDTHG